eukprot:CAMPEP_0117545654 /NCGR_PEP_ID=MMETSP0784-20121206/46208_1 /TAXON_ID=39447 /ORGANISM="" /LENGTH=106 /DNA_ID=CAMNT_0005342511 /DNA_START=102 /DNA_END=420 /DNA_ORIENTATION=-
MTPISLSALMRPPESFNGASAAGSMAGGEASTRARPRFQDVDGQVDLARKRAAGCAASCRQWGFYFQDAFGVLRRWERRDRSPCEDYDVPEPHELEAFHIIANPHA